MSFDTVITNGQVVLTNSVEKIDIGIIDGKICALGLNLVSHAQEVIDAKGNLVLPGMIDAHVHINEPGRSDWEDYTTGTRALAKGGTTSMVVMPLNALPARTTKTEFDRQKKFAEKSSMIDFAFYGGLVPGNQAELKKMQASGAVAFKAFMATCGDVENPTDFRNIDDYDLLKGMEAIAEIGSIISLHAENAVICDRLAEEYQAVGKTSVQDYVNSRPVLSEVEAVTRALYFAKLTGARLHFVHISTPEAVALIQEAKMSGQDVTLESCTHYFALDTQKFIEIGAQAKCSPPLRSHKNQEGLFRDLARGQFDFITSDHSPSPLSMKEHDNIFDVWGGISGAQNNVDLTFDLFVNQHHLPVTEFARLTSEGPARRFGLMNKGDIRLGHDADFVILNPHESYTLRREDLEYKNKQSAYLGFTIGATVKQTILRGRTIYQAEKGLTKALKPKFLAYQK
jgi:allantoinase